MFSAASASVSVRGVAWRISCPTRKSSKKLPVLGLALVAHARGLQLLDRRGQRQRALGLLDMQVLDHAAVDRDDALALGLRRLEGG